jgi:hypothetical protein
MKKLLLISILFAASSGLAFGQGQLSTSTGTITTTTTTIAAPAPTVPETARPPAAAPLVPTEGVVQVALRNGNPAQLINPLAPGRFGTAHEHATHDPKDPGKPKGIVLFAWSF